MKKIVFLSLFFLWHVVNAQNFEIKKSAIETYFKALEWRLIGPFRGGRSCATTGVPSNPNVYYFGSTGGGVWKTIDKGVNWNNISDGYFGGSIGTVSVSGSDPNVIYVGTGEETLRGNVSPGEGVWKSDDAGKTWQFKGLKNTRHISRIRIHPKNPDIVYLAAIGDLFKPNQERGIYKSIDGGNNWKRVLFPSDSAGCVDLILDPVNPKIIYTTSWNIQRTPYSLSSGGRHSTIWKSTDGGDSWVDLRKNKGLPKGIWGISCIAVCPSHNDRLYAMIEHESGGLFRSDDAGLTWKKINDSRDLRQRAWYFSRIYADPKNEDVVYVLNVSFHKSIDAGASFKTISNHHGDNHDLWIDPNNSLRMIVGNDGGAQISENGGSNWSTLNNQPTAQFYRVTTDNAFPFRIYAAQQDNSTIRIRHRTQGNQISSRDWESTAGGESGHMAVDPNDPDIVYGGSYGGLLTRYDHRRDLERNINVWPDNPIGYGAIDQKYRFQWNFPIFFSPHDPKRLYCASNHLHVSHNEGQSWEVISPDLTKNDSSKMMASGGPITKDNTSVEYYCTIFAAAESPRVKDLLWVGSDDGLVHVSKNGGKTWNQVTPPTLPNWSMINSIEPDPFIDGGCYLAATSYKSGDYKPYLFKTEDYGKTWTKITNGISEEHFTRVLRADPKKKGLLYCGTERALYVSWSDGKNWVPFQLNLPIVPITDLAIKDDILIAATQGRSIWTLDDLTPLRHGLPEVNVKKNFILPPKPTYRIEGSMNKKISNSGINHPTEIMLYCFLDSVMENDTIQIFLLDQKRDTVNRFSNYPDEKSTSIELTSGSNLVLLNYRYPAAKSLDNMILWWSSLSGPKAAPGQYKIIFKSRQLFDSTVCEIKRDMSYPVTDADVKKQFDFIKNVRDKINDAHKTIYQIRDVRSQMNDVLSRVEKTTATDTLFKLKDSINIQLTKIENELYQTKNKSGQDPINYPIKLTNKLAHLIALYDSGSYPPTDQAEAYRIEASALVDLQIQKFEAIKTNELMLLNQLIREKAVNVIKPKEE